MTEFELVQLWMRVRWQIIASQVAPTFLLAFVVWLGLQGISDASLALRIATAAILLAAGILGALAQYGSATEGIAILRDLAAVGASSATGRHIAVSAWSMNIVRFVTPTIFVVIFVALLAELFAG